MNSLRLTRLASTILVFGFSAAASAGFTPNLPEYFPTCNSPQMLNPPTPIGSQQSQSSAMVWNGNDYAVAWVDNSTSHLMFRRFFADGTPFAAAVTVSTLNSISNYPPSLVWNGAGYGVAWTGVSASSNYQVYFARLNPIGTEIAAETKISFYGVPDTNYSENPSLAWSGASYAVVWVDYRNAATSADIYLTEINGTTGVVSRNDIVVTNATNTQLSPTLAWDSGGGVYVAFWQDNQSGVKTELAKIYFFPGGFVGGASIVVSGAGNSISPSLVDAGSGLGLVWQDNRDFNYEIYFARVDLQGNLIGLPLRVTNDPATSEKPKIVWTGAEFGIFWDDYRSVPAALWFQRVASSGVMQGLNLQVSQNLSAIVYPSAAFGVNGYMVGGVLSGGISYPGMVMSWGCAADTTPPTCPGGFVAYNITGTTATIGWLPASDPETDIAYYNVYRNAVPVGKTSNAYFNDSGLSLSSTYGYAIQPVNAAQLQNTACQTLIYLKTNATLTLTMNKSTPDAVLNWTNAGFNNYNIFRGYSPQVMSQIGATPTLTAPDPNALTNSLSYFYSVDNPGP